MIYNVYLIRHAKTQANFEGRYIGTSDESLNEAGKIQLKKKIMEGYYPEVDKVYASPKKRCSQTAKLIYPDLSIKIVPALSEYDFGEFEGKNYLQLKNNPFYQEWVASGGTVGFPGGEDIQNYKERCCQAFEDIIREMKQDKTLKTALIIHGGSIMAIMENFSPVESVFFDWHVENCEGYRLEIEDELWQKEKIIASCNKL